MLTAMNAEQVLADRDARAVDGQVPVADPYEGLCDRLSSRVDAAWQRNRQAKVDVQRDMLSDLRQRRGEYAPEKLSQIREQGGSEAFMMITNVKCRAAESWIRDTIFPESGERPFQTQPTPMPDIPPEVAQQIEQIAREELEAGIAAGMFPSPEKMRMRINQLSSQVKARVKEEAKRACLAMDDEIDDLFTEGDWYQAMDECIGDFVTLPGAIIKGPVMRKGKRLRWERGANGRRVPIVDEELTPFFYRVSPLDAYPSPDARNIHDGDFIEHIRMRRGALAAMRDVPGYSKERIDAALSEYKDGYLLHDVDEQAQREALGQDNWWNAQEKTISALEYHGSVQGAELIEWGMEPESVPDPMAEYPVIALKVGRFVVRCMISDDPLGRRPYSMESFERVNDSFWGEGIPRIMRDLQDVCNACARAMVNNMSLSSGPMVEVEVDRLADGEVLDGVRPWRMYQTKASKTTTPSAAIRYHQPENVTAELRSVYDYFARLADDYTGVPAYTTGSPVGGGAASTSSGLSMLMSNAARGIKRAVSRIDNLIEGSLERTHTHVLMYNPDTSLHGDIRLVARGALSLTMKEQQQARKTEFLNATANPMDMDIMRKRGRAAMLRDAMASFGLVPDDFLPTDDELLAEQRQQDQANAAMAQIQQAQAGAETVQSQSAAREAAAKAAQTPAPKNLALDGSPAGGLNLQSGAN